MTENQTPDAENTEHVHDESCVINGFQNFTMRDFELSEMILDVTKDQMADLANNIVVEELGTLIRSVEAGHPVFTVREETRAAWNGSQEVSPEDRSLATVMYYSGGKAMAMTMVALGLVKLDAVLNLLKTPGESFPAGMFPPEFEQALAEGRGMVLALTEEDKQKLGEAEDKDAALAEIVNGKMDRGEMPDNPLLREALAANAVKQGPIVEHPDSGSGR